MLENVPFFVGGGAEHSPEVVRQDIYDGSGGAEGISHPGALRVQAEATPTTTVRVAPGGALINNRYPGGAYQSYSARNRSQTSVPIRATGSAGGRTDLLVLRILDPQYEGQPPADPQSFQYTRFEVIEGVSSSIKTFAQLGRNYPAVELARINIPANTATITANMITDLRTVAQPKQDIFQMARPNVTGDKGMTLTSRSDYPDGEWFPNVGGQNNNGAYYVDIPKWATRMIIRCEWLSVRLTPKAGYGYVWVTYGPDGGSQNPTHKTQGFAWDADEGSNTYRTNFILEQEVSVPASWRGTTQPFVPRGTINSSASSYPGKVELTSTSGMSFKVTFKEVADPNDADT